MDSIKDFLLKETVEETSEETAETKEKAAKKTKPKAEYSVSFVSGPDFGIRKKTTRTSVVFVYIISAGQMYIKNEKTGEISSDLSRKDIAKYFADLPDEGMIFPEEAKPTWIKNLNRGLEFADGLIDVFYDIKMKNYIVKNMISFQGLPEAKRYRGYCEWDSEKDLTKTFRIISEIVGQDEAKRLFTEYLFHLGATEHYNYKASRLFGYSEQYGCKPGEPFSVFSFLVDRYGLDGVRKYYKAIIESPMTDIPSPTALMELFYGEQRQGRYTYHSRNVLSLQDETRVFNLDRFIEYTIYEAHLQGFENASDIENFFQTWKDALDLEVLVYGKIVDKYPDNILSYHQILSVKARAVQQIIDNQKWNSAIERMSKFEYEKGQYMIVSPKTKDDMIEEARQQSNCLASYVNLVMEGDCMIFFVRRKNDPETSFITIEVRGDGSLGQVKARFNKNPSDDIMHFVREWHKKIVMGDALCA